MSENLLFPLLIILAGIARSLVEEQLKQRAKREFESETQDVASSLQRAQSASETKVPPETVAEVYILWIKTRNKALYEVEDEPRREQCIALLDKAEVVLNDAVEEENPHLLSQVYKLVQYVDSLAAEGRFTPYYVVALLMIFFAGLAYLIAVTWDNWTVYETRVILGIPFPVLLWGAIGSATAPLFRFMHSSRAETIEPFKLFIVRPFIGMVMGAAIYLVVVSGLLIFSGSTTIVNPQLLWVLAFIGGFSESLTSRALEKVEARVTEDRPRPAVDDDEAKRIRAGSPLGPLYRSGRRSTPATSTNSDRVPLTQHTPPTEPSVKASDDPPEA